MRRVTPLLLLLSLGCMKEEALMLTFSADDTRLEDDCYDVTVTSTGGELLGSASLARETNKTQYRVAIYRGELPDTVRLTVAARARVPEDNCENVGGIANGVVNGEASFSATRFELSLYDALDTDEDGAVAEAWGGEDCDDDVPGVSPFRPEVCGDGMDNDCNELTDCEDAHCEESCAGVVPTRVVFANQPITAPGNTCAGPITLLAVDATGDAGLWPNAPELSDAPITVFGDSTCTGTPPTSLPATIYFRGLEAGTFELTAEASGLLPATQPLVIEQVPRLSLADGGTIVAGTCLHQGVRLLWPDGGEFFPTQPFSFQVEATPQAGTTLSSDAECEKENDGTNTFSPDGGEFAVLPTRAGPLTLTVSANGYFSGQATWQVDPGLLQKVTVTPPDGTVVPPDTCIPVTAMWRDEYDNPVTPPPPIVATLTADSGVTMSITSDCSAPGSSLELPSAGDTPVWVRASREVSFHVGFMHEDSGSNAGVDLTAQRPFPAETLRRYPLTVTTFERTPHNGYDGYTLEFTLADDELIAHQNQLEIYFWDVTTASYIRLHRLAVSAEGGAWRVVFRMQADQPADTSAQRYDLFVTDGGQALLSDPAQVYHRIYEFDESQFDDGGLAPWVATSPGIFELSTEHALTGSRSLKLNANDGDAGEAFLWLDVGDERDVQLQSWWLSPDPPRAKAGLLVRNVPGTIVGHELLASDARPGGLWHAATSLDGGSRAILDDFDTDPAWDGGWSLKVVRATSFLEYSAGAGHYGDAFFDAGVPNGGHVALRWSALPHPPMWIDQVIVLRRTHPSPLVDAGAPISPP